MKVLFVTESFLPRVNGVTNSVCRVLDHLAARDHEAMVVAPAPGPDSYAGYPVRLVRGVTLPMYPSFRVGLPSTAVSAAFHDFAPDVVHLASPVTVGATGAFTARQLGVPSVAVFQTDLAGFARRYRLGWSAPLLWWWLRRLHTCADRTLAASTATMRQLAQQRIPRVSLWPRGVDTERFHPRHCSQRLRNQLAPDGEVLVGYVGRLSADKRVRQLSHLTGIPGARLVVVGDGPDRRRLQRQLPDAAFLGFLDGPELSAAFASLDVFVHTGADETFGQTIQEALAAQVAVVAPAAGGPLDLIVDGRTGLRYDPEAPGQLRDAVTRLVTDSGLRARLGRSGRASVSTRSWATVCDQILDHYAAVLAPTGRSARPATAHLTGDGPRYPQVQPPVPVATAALEEGPVPSHHQGPSGVAH